MKAVNLKQISVITPLLTGLGFILSGCGTPPPPKYDIGSLNLEDGQPPVPVAVAVSEGSHLHQAPQQVLLLDSASVEAAKVNHNVVVAVTGAMTVQSESNAELQAGLGILNTAEGAVSIPAQYITAAADSTIAKAQKTAAGASGTTQTVIEVNTDTPGASAGGTVTKKTATGTLSASVGDVYNGSVAVINQSVGGYFSATTPVKTFNLTTPASICACQ